MYPYYPPGMPQRPSPPFYPMYPPLGSYPMYPPLGSYPTYGPPHPHHYHNGSTGPYIHLNNGHEHNSPSHQSASVPPGHVLVPIETLNRLSQQQPGPPPHTVRVVDSSGASGVSHSMQGQSDPPRSPRYTY